MKDKTVKEELAGLQAPLLSALRENRRACPPAPVDWEEMTGRAVRHSARRRQMFYRVGAAAAAVLLLLSAWLGFFNPQTESAAAVADRGVTALPEAELLAYVEDNIDEFDLQLLVEEAEPLTAAGPEGAAEEEWEGLFGEGEEEPWY